MTATNNRADYIRLFQKKSTVSLSVILCGAPMIDGCGLQRHDMIIDRLQYWNVAYIDLMIES